MSIIFILIFISSLVASTFVVAFIWSVKSGQYDDTYSPSVRLLFDDSVKKEPEEKTAKKKRKSD
jgi:cbb3-type cytochrome oxidase maturation protein